MGQVEEALRGRAAEGGDFESGEAEFWEGFGGRDLEEGFFDRGWGAGRRREGSASRCDIVAEGDGEQGFGGVFAGSESVGLVELRCV